jgi:hypothetical protein
MSEEIKVAAPKLYYIQNGYVGNAINWWRPEGKGYTTNIKEAGKFSEAQAKQQANTRVDDVAWPCDYIDNNEQAHKVIIDAQFIRRIKSFQGRKR